MQENEQFNLSQPSCKDIFYSWPGPFNTKCHNVWSKVCDSLLTVIASEWLIENVLAPSHSVQVDQQRASPDYTLLMIHLFT